MDKMASVGCPVIVVGGRRARDSRTSRSLIYPGRADMLCPSVISRFGTLADKQRFDAASAMGQTRSSGDVASMSGLPPKTAVRRTFRNGRFVPEADISGATRSP